MHKLHAPVASAIALACTFCLAEPARAAEVGAGDAPKATRKDTGVLVGLTEVAGQRVGFLGTTPAHHSQGTPQCCRCTSPLTRVRLRRWAWGISIRPVGSISAFG